MDSRFYGNDKRAQDDALSIYSTLRLAITVFLILLLASSSYAINIDNLKIRPALKPDYLTSFYLNIENDSNQLDYLLEVRIINQPNSHIQISKTVIERNIARIIKIDRLIIPAHSTVSLSPIGIYIVATNLFQAKSLKLEFIFENAGKVVVDVENLR